MKATAQRIGNSKKEQILIDGEVFLKSVAIGRWNWISATTVKDDRGESNVIYTKHATRQAAERFTPSDYVSCSYVKPDMKCRYYSQNPAAFEPDMAEYNDIASRPGARINREFGPYGGSSIVARYTWPYTKTVHQVDRDYQA